MKRFKQLFFEAASTQEYISFVENTLTTNQVDPQAANSFLVNQYNYPGVLYKVIFCPVAEVQNFSQGGIPDAKAIADYIVKKFNTTRYVFFSKTLKSLENAIKYPGLYKITEDQCGVIYSNKTAGSIDLTKYEELGGKNIEVLKRVEETEPILSFEDITINKIEGLYVYTQENGWQFRTRLDQPIFPQEVTSAPPSGDEETVQDKPSETPTSDQEIKTGRGGMNNTQKASPETPKPRLG